MPKAQEFEQTYFHFHTNKLKASMEGCRVVRIDEVVEKVDIFVTATGNKKIILRSHMNKMKNGAIVCNMGHSDTEIDVASLKTSDLVWEKVSFFSIL